MSERESESDEPASGVQALIARIRDRGVEAGRSEGERLLTEAQAEAARLVAEAEERAEALLAEARARIQSEEQAGLAALRMAARDTGLQLRQAVLAAFEEHVRRLVTEVTLDGSFLHSLVLTLAGQAADEHLGDKQVQIQVAKFLAGDSDAELDEAERRAALAISSLMLREGVELIPTDKVRGGARVRVVGEELEIDLTDEAIATLLLERMIPRFRSILEGVE